MSIAQIAEAVKCSKGTVRHWLRQYGLKTQAQRWIGEESTRAMRRAGKATVMRECRKHGVTEFWLEGRGYYRCKRCRLERVSRRRRKMKLILVAEAGGRCALCGYDRCVGALHFHHVDPSSKRVPSEHAGRYPIARGLRVPRWRSARCCAPTATRRLSRGMVTLDGGRAQRKAVWPRIQRTVLGSSTGRALDC